ncbi:MAG: trigger factor [Phycisphaerales bacterium]|nr:trigger factor [Phycisphaerales bacterium]
MSDDTAIAEGFDFKIEDAGPARKKLEVTVTADAIQAKLDASMGTLQSQSALPGFRKGRAPRQLLNRRFGKAIQEETLNELMQEGCRQAFESLNIRPLGNLEPADPDFVPELQPGKPMNFAVVFEVVPEFDLPDMSAITIARPQLDVEDSHIDEELDRQCMRAGTAEEREKNFKTGDRLLGAAELYLEDDEEPIFTHEQVLAVIPEKGESGQILGLLVDDLGSHFAKSAIGKVVEISTTGPDTHEREDIRGKKLRIRFTINLAEHITPCTPEDLIERFSLASIDVLREQVRLALEQQRDEEQSSAMRTQMLTAVTDAIDMELPEKISGNHAAQDLERIRFELMQQGLTSEEVEEKLAEVRERSNERSLQNLKTWFILERIANDQDIAVSEQEINGYITTMAMRQGVRPDKMRSELIKQDRIDNIARSVRERKAADHLVSLATIEDISMDEWAERQAAASST